MGFSLRDEGERYKRIYSGKEWIGRVCQHADGTYIGLVGKYITVRGCRTEKEAFNEAVAQSMRYEIPRKPKPKPTQRHNKRPSKPAGASAVGRAVVQAITEPFTARVAYMRPRH
jgi:hypothetical protein